MFSVILIINKTTKSMFSPVRLIMLVTEAAVNTHGATTLNGLTGTTLSDVIQLLQKHFPSHGDLFYQISSQSAFVAAYSINSLSLEVLSNSEMILSCINLKLCLARHSKICHEQDILKSDFLSISGTRCLQKVFISGHNQYSFETSGQGSTFSLQNIHRAVKETWTLFLFQRTISIPVSLI